MSNGLISSSSTTLIPIQVNTKSDFNQQLQDIDERQESNMNTESERKNRDIKGMTLVNYVQNSLEN